MSFPDTLYHYTTPAGLLGILESNTIWATHIFHLNDASEFKRGLQIAAAQVQAFKDKQTQMPTQVKFELGVFSRAPEMLASIDVSNVFVVSLTEEGDQLSQWRAYSGSHSGFSIGFDAGRLSEVALCHGFSLGKCIYDEHSQQDVVTQLVADCIEDRMLSTPVKEFGTSMLQLAPLLKHPSFSEEREWRLVSLPIWDDTQFRPGASTLIPYYRLPTIAEDGRSCVSSITVGPTPHPELASHSVRSLVKARNLTDIAVGHSKIPLRTW